MCAFDQALAFSVVTKGSALQNGWRFDSLEGARKIGRASHRAIRSARDRCGREKVLFAKPILRGVQDGTRRARLAFGRAPFDRLPRNVFEFEGEKIETFGELADGRFVFISRGDLTVRELPCWRIFLRTENMNVITHPARGDRKHSAELAAAHQADGRARQIRPRHGTRCVSTASVCRFRNASSFFRISSSVVARMLAASKAAFVAPAVPIASVPTGTPAGICAIERRESIPCRACHCTGTPRTGSQAWAAIIPGKWAAPPAPAMITCNPRSAAVRANSAIISGVR